MKAAKLQKQLVEAREMYEVVGMECKELSEKGYYVQLKSAQSRSLSLAKKITNLEAKINQL